MLFCQKKFFDLLVNVRKTLNTVISKTKKGDNQDFYLEVVGNSMKYQNTMFKYRITSCLYKPFSKFVYQKRLALVQNISSLHRVKLYCTKSIFRNIESRTYIYISKIHNNTYKIKSIIGFCMPIHNSIYPLLQYCFPSGCFMSRLRKEHTSQCFFKIQSYVKILDSFLLLNFRTTQRVYFCKTKVNNTQLIDQAESRQAAIILSKIRLEYLYHHRVQ